ncbi:unnamed protein product [Protopolystoma xenopodis]|uniref:Uncharacterized protein n=1 Tax=Protopolystoma xenopodis TaxID=117903 RepID=A0A3S5BPN2_9PLAT|nr:unnamed protein product [Protopolystoma xenopodis]
MQGIPIVLRRQKIIGSAGGVGCHVDAINRRPVPFTQGGQQLLPPRDPSVGIDTPPSGRVVVGCVRFVVLTTTVRLSGWATATCHCNCTNCLVVWPHFRPAEALSLRYRLHNALSLDSRQPLQAMERLISLWLLAILSRGWSQTDPPTGTEENEPNIPTHQLSRILINPCQQTRNARFGDGQSENSPFGKMVAKSRRRRMLSSTPSGAAIPDWCCQKAVGTSSGGLGWQNCQSLRRPGVLAIIHFRYQKGAQYYLCMLMTCVMMGQDAVHRRNCGPGPVNKE